MLMTQGYTQLEDPVDALVDVVDGFAKYVSESEKSMREAARYRGSLLWVHALAATLMAPLFGYTGRDGMVGPAFAFLRTIPGSPASVAVILGVGGFILGMGSVIGLKRTTIVGLGILAFWYCLVGISFMVPIFRYAAGLTPAKPTLYAPVLYLHLTIIMAVHIGVQLKKLRQ